MALGFTARETIPIVFVGFMICSVVVTLTGKMGATYAVPYPVIVRSIFGMYGSYPVILIRGISHENQFIFQGVLTSTSFCRTYVDCNSHCSSW